MIKRPLHLSPSAPGGKLLATGMLALGAWCFTSAAALAQTPLFEDRFNDLSQWSGPTNNPPEGDSSPRIIEVTDLDAGSFFGEAANSYLRLYKAHPEKASNAITANNAFTEPSNVVTISFDLWDNSSVTPGAATLMVSSEKGVSGTDFFHQVRLEKGVLNGVTGAYRPDQHNRIQVIMNNSTDAVSYLGGEYTVASDSLDVWVNGVRVLESNTYGRSSYEGLPVGTPLASMRLAVFTTSQAEVLMDNFVVQKGAVIDEVAPPPAYPEPLVEFTFEDNSLTNTGLLAGEGAFDATERAPVFGPGVAGGTAMDSRAASAMGNLAYKDGQDPAMKYQPGAGLNNLQSITMTGWFRTEENFNNLAFLFAKPNSIQIYGRNDTLEFNILTNIDGTRTSRIIKSASPWHLETGRWVFFAVTADVTQEAADTTNAHMYYGYEDSQDVVLDASASLIPGIIRSVSNAAAVGNYINDHPFKGLIDNLRIWGSTEDGSAALSQEQVRAIWAADLGKSEPAPFRQWASLYFSEAEMADESISGPHATPAGDGIPNVAKYAFGLHPLQPGQEGLPTIDRRQENIALTYTRRIAAAELTYIAETSEDLVTWTPDAEQLGTVTVQQVDEEFESVTINLPASADTRRFLRVRIEMD